MKKQKRKTVIWGIVIVYFLFCFINIPTEAIGTRVNEINESVTLARKTDPDKSVWEVLIEIGDSGNAGKTGNAGNKGSRGNAGSKGNKGNHGSRGNAGNFGQSGS